MHCAYCAVNFPPALRLPRFICALAALGFSWLSVAADPPAAKDKAAADRPGEWVPLHEDGTPWKHTGTDLRFPQALGPFKLRTIFEDKRAVAGVDLNYVDERDNMKADVVIFPSRQDISKVPDVMVMVHQELDQLIKELQSASKAMGYVETKREKVEEKNLNTWAGNLPLVTQTVEFGPADAVQVQSRPAITQWLGLVLYQDYYVQMSIVRPSAGGAEGDKKREELVKKLMQCVREPSVAPAMLNLCRKYVDKPLTEDGRHAADSLLAYSRESAVFQVVYPGDVLTPALDEVSKVSKDAGLDMLRAYIVGSSVVGLQNGTADQSMEEGARLMVQLYRLVRKDNDKIESSLMEELSKASEKERAATFFHEKMKAASAAQ